MRDALDKFYTAETVAKHCIEKTLEIFTNSDIIVEPSAGGGAFSNNIPDCYAFDVSPTIDSVIAKNWFSVSKDDFPSYTTMLVIGNPPFGQRSALAKDFIKHSINNLSATTIAFILPKTFNKRINQTVFPANWRLIHKIELDREESTFTLYNSHDLYIPCDYFIWTNDINIMPSVDLREQKVEAPEEIVFLPRNSPDAQFTINGNNGRVKDISEVTNPKAEHYMKVSENFDKEEIISKLKRLDYNFHSSVNGGIAWVNKEDISRAFRNTV